MKEQSSFRERAKFSQRILRSTDVHGEFSDLRCLMNTLTGFLPLELPCKQSNMYLHNTKSNQSRYHASQTILNKLTFNMAHCSCIQDIAKGLEHIRFSVHAHKKSN